MKTCLENYILIIVICIYSSNVYCQKLLISTENIQTVYQNLENIINTNIECFNFPKMLFTDNGLIIKKEEKLYWNPEKRGPSYLKLITISERDTIILDSILFNVKICPLPLIDLNKRNWHSGIGSYKSEKLVFDFEKSYDHLKLDEKIRIISFTMEVKVKDEKGNLEEHEFHSKNEIFPKEFAEIRKQLKKGNILEVKFSKIKIECDWRKDVKYYDDEFKFDPNNHLKWIWQIR